MKRMLVMLAALPLLASCGPDEPANTPRFVDQQKVESRLVPIHHVDGAVQTEAMTHMRLIYQSVQQKIALGGDRQALYAAVQGRLDDNKLAAMGLSAGQLAGTYYRHTDYTVSITGNTMTITAAETGTRGRVDPQTFTLR